MATLEIWIIQNLIFWNDFWSLSWFRLSLANGFHVNKLKFEPDRLSSKGNQSKVNISPQHMVLILLLELADVLLTCQIHEPFMYHLCTICVQSVYRLCTDCVQSGLLNNSDASQLFFHRGRYLGHITSPPQSSNAENISDYLINTAAGSKI